jgi:hypothetical protein
MTVPMPLGYEPRLAGYDVGAPDRLPRALQPGDLMTPELERLRLEQDERNERWTAEIQAKRAAELAALSAEQRLAELELDRTVEAEREKRGIDLSLPPVSGCGWATLEITRRAERLRHTAEQTFRELIHAERVVEGARRALGGPVVRGLSRALVAEEDLTQARQRLDVAGARFDDAREALEQCRRALSDPAVVARIERGNALAATGAFAGYLSEDLPEAGELRRIVGEYVGVVAALIRRQQASASMHAEAAGVARELGIECPSARETLPINLAENWVRARAEAAAKAALGEHPELEGRVVDPEYWFPRFRVR